MSPENTRKRIYVLAGKVRASAKHLEDSVYQLGFLETDKVVRSDILQEVHLIESALAGLKIQLEKLP